jgi:hypothetical protein
VMSSCSIDDFLSNYRHHQSSILDFMRSLDDPVFSKRICTIVSTPSISIISDESLTSSLKFDVDSGTSTAPNTAYRHWNTLTTNLSLGKAACDSINKALPPKKANCKQAENEKDTSSGDSRIKSARAAAQVAAYSEKQTNVLRLNLFSYFPCTANSIMPPRYATTKALVIASECRTDRRISSLPPIKLHKLISSKHVSTNYYPSLSYPEASVPPSFPACILQVPSSQSAEYLWTRPHRRTQMHRPMLFQWMVGWCGAHDPCGPSPEPN